MEKEVINMAIKELGSKLGAILALEEIANNGHKRLQPCQQEDGSQCTKLNPDLTCDPKPYEKSAVECPLNRGPLVVVSNDQKIV